MRISQLEAFALTLIIEGAAAFFIAPRFKLNARRAALAAVAGSTLTHPLLWNGALRLYAILGLFTIPLLEGCVVVTESLGYRLLATRSWRLALLISAIVNFLSWLAGEILYRVP